MRLDTRGIAQAFADGRDARGSSALRAEGDTLYSYKEPIAKRGANKTAWVTARRFSKTTSKHTSFAAGALARKGYEVYCSEEPDVCIRCQMPPGAHADGKCLFDSAMYRAAA